MIMCQTPGSKIITYRAYSCRALNENEPEAKFEFSANGTRTLNENERERRSNLVKRVHVEHLAKRPKEDEPKAK